MSDEETNVDTENKAANRVRGELAKVEWGSPPPEHKAGRPPNGDGLRTVELVVLAETRPGEWGRYDVGTGQRVPAAGVMASRLRDAGLEATQRGTVVYFRAVDTGVTTP